MNDMFMVVGRLTKDVELKQTKNGKAVIDLYLASKQMDETLFINVNVFGGMAESIAKYCKKGDLVGVRGIIKNHNWEDKEGKKHYDYQFIADKVSFLQSKSSNEEKNVDVPKNTKTEYKDNVEIKDEDLPF